MDEIRHTEVIKQLQEIGLSPHEAEVYSTVLRLGEASGGIVIGEVTLHREQVYRALKSLVEKGFLTYYIKRKRGYYAAVDPSVFIDKIKTKLDIAESLQPYLREMHQRQPHVIRVREGAEAIKEMYDDIITTLQKDAEYLVLGGSGKDFYEIVKDFFPRYAKMFTEKNISVRMTSYAGEEFSGVLSAQEKIAIRKVPQAYEVPAATVIYGDKVAIQILDPDSVSVITIDSWRLADAYRQTFETMWQLGI